MQQESFVLISSYDFGQVFVHYLMSALIIWKWTAGCIYQLITGEFPLAASFQKKIDQENFLLKATTNWAVIAVRWSAKYFLLQIPQYFGKVSRREENKQQVNWKALCFKGKRKKASLKWKQKNPSIILLVGNKKMRPI